MSLEDRINGVSKYCSIDAKKCLGYAMLGDRACDTSYIPGFNKDSDVQILCKYNKNYKPIKAESNEKF